MQYVFGIIVFWFGAALGSFLAVVANRYNTGLPFFKGRSICFSCNEELRKKDLVPIFSFIFLKGKCGHCQSKIPKETLFAEVVMGILSVLAALKSGFLFYDFSLAAVIYYLIVTAIFAVILLISIYDLKHFIIPDSFLVLFFIFSFLHNSHFIILNSFSFFTIFNYFLSGLILALPFLLIFLISKGRALGFGDVKYIATLGFFLGVAEGLSAVVLAFWIGAAFSLLALSLNKLNHRLNLPIFRNNLTIKSEVPFGPFISLGIVLSFWLSLDLFKIHALFF